jgi:RNA polymerase sigma factor (sigma-70 family)
VSADQPPRPDGEPPPGWREELEECFSATAPMVYRILLRFAQGDRELAAVVGQEAFRKATQKWSTVRVLTDEERRAWLVRVAVTSAVDAFRRADTERDKRQLIQARYQPRPVDVHEDAMACMAVECFVKVVDEMPPQQARVAFLYWRCEWTNSEIARLLEITPGRVSQHIANARAKLQSELSPYVSFQPDEPEGGARP